MDVIDRFFQAHCEETPVDDLFCDDFKAKQNGLVISGPYAARLGLLEWRKAFPDGRFEFLGRLEQGDDVAVTWRFRGTQTGPFMGRSPGGASVHVDGATRFTRQGGCIHRLATRWDMDGLLRQIDG